MKLAMLGVLALTAPAVAQPVDGVPVEAPPPSAALTLSTNAQLPYDHDFSPAVGARAGVRSPGTSGWQVVGGGAVAVRLVTALDDSMATKSDVEKSWFVLAGLRTGAERGRWRGWLSVAAGGVASNYQPPANVSDDRYRLSAILAPGAGGSYAISRRVAFTVESDLQLQLGGHALPTTFALAFGAAIGL